MGYGRWEELVREVRKSWVMKFDWHMKTRVPKELGQRVEYLTKLIERELADEDAAKREQERKAKKAARANSGAEPAGGKRVHWSEDDEGGAAKKRRECSESSS